MNHVPLNYVPLNSAHAAESSTEPNAATGHTRRERPGRLAVAIAAALALVASLLFVAPAYAAGAPSRYASPTGSGTSCSVAAPCSLTTAVTAAPAGATVQLAAGTYASATVSGGNGTAAAPITVTAAAGSTAVLAGLTTTSPYVNWVGLSVTAPFFFNAGATGSTMSDMYFDATGLFLRAASITVRDSLFENGSSLDGIQVAAATDALIEGNTIRNYDQNRDNGLHADCIQVFDSSDITIRANSLSNCYNAGLIFSVGRGNGLDNIVVESNFIQGCTVKTTDCAGGSAADLREPSGTNIIVRNNTFLDGSVRIDPLPGLVFDRNIVEYIADCASPMSNTIVASWNTKMCAQPAELGTKGNRAGTVAFVNESTADLHLTSAASASITPTGSYPRATLDYDGELLTATVAGADQFAGVKPAPAPTPTPTATPTAAPTAAPTATPTPTPTPTSSPTPGPDRTAPVAEITSPAASATITKGSTAVVTIDATDNVAVTGVSLWVGTAKAGDATRQANGSWKYSTSTAGMSGNITITARAVDAAGNVGASAPVTVRIR